MFQKFIFFAFISLLVIINFSFFPNLFSKYFPPDLILVIVIYWSATGKFMEIWKKVLLAGFLIDLVYFWPIGTNMLSFLIISFFLTSISRRVYMRRKILGFSTVILIVMCATPAYYLIMKGLAEIMKTTYVVKAEAISLAFTPSFFVQKTFLNAILMALLYLPLEKLDKFVSLYSNKSSFEGRFFKR